MSPRPRFTSKIDQIRNAVVGVIKTILELKDMLMNVLASMQVIENPDPWSQQMLAAIGKEEL